MEEIRPRLIGDESPSRGLEEEIGVDNNNIQVSFQEDPNKSFSLIMQTNQSTDQFIEEAINLAAKVNDEDATVRDLQQRTEDFPDEIDELPFPQSSNHVPKL